MIEQIVGLLGAGMILAAFGAQQAGKWTSNARPYLHLYLLGCAMLTWSAVAAKSAGLIALEGSWAVISLASLVRASRKRAT
jgi:hypothetical protein